MMRSDEELGKMIDFVCCVSLQKLAMLSKTKTL
jgi:hypothetical protein